MLELTCERAGIEDGHGRARPRLRLGVAVASGWRERYPSARDPGGVELRIAAGVHRVGGAPRAALREPRGRHGRHERVRHRPPLRPRRLRRDVRAHAELRGPARPRRRVAASRGRLFVHVFSHRRFAYAFETAARLDGAHFFTGGHDALRTTSCRASSATCASWTSWALNGTHYAAHGRGLARAARRERRCRARRPGGRRRRRRLAPLARSLAGLLPRLRGAVRLPKRKRVGRLALPLRAIPGQYVSRSSG